MEQRVWLMLAFSAPRLTAIISPVMALEMDGAAGNTLMGAGGKGSESPGSAFQPGMDAVLV